MATVAADQLRDNVALLRRLRKAVPDEARAYAELAQACEITARGLADAPFKRARRRGKLLSEMMPLGSAQHFGNAEIAGLLLRDCARVFREADGGATGLRADLFNAHINSEGAAEQLQQAPGGAPGPEMEALRPYLDAAHRYHHLTLPDPEVTRRLLETPRFRDLAEKVFEITNGSALAKMHEQARVAWSGRLVSVWLLLEGSTPEPLTETEAAAIAWAVANPRAPWSAPPIVAGDWSEASPGDAAVLLGLISEVARDGPKRAPLAVARYCDRVRTRPLACYGGALLVEAQGYGAGGQAGLLQAVILGDRVLLADGRNDGLLALSNRFGPGLDSPEARRDYLMLFINWVRHGSGSRFQPVESVEALAGRLAGGLEAASAYAECLAPIVEHPADPTGAWPLEARVCFDDCLWRAVFTVTAGGEVTMVDDEVLAVDLPTRPEMQDGWFVHIADKSTETGAAQ